MNTTLTVSAFKNVGFCWKMKEPKCSIQGKGVYFILFYFILERMTPNLRHNARETSQLAYKGQRTHLYIMPVD